MHAVIRATNENATSYLQDIDWSFSSRGKGHAIESIHPYPAKFIPEIPQTLLTLYPPKSGTIVFDPFCGSGTTLCEAQRAGWQSVGIDLNPIATLISKVKTSPIPAGIEKTVAEVVDNAKSRRDFIPVDIPNVDHWFKSEVQEAVAALLEAIDSLAPERSRDVLRLALSSILVRVSNQESDTRYAAIDKGIAKNDVFQFFLAACGKIVRALLSRDWSLPQARVIATNALEVTPETIGSPVGLIITSPPYPNAYEYWLYHKYRMWWLGFDPLAVKSAEIGARAHFFKRDHHTAQNFHEQMDKVCALAHEVLVKGGHACFVIGRSKIHGRVINNAEIIAKSAMAHGLKLRWQVERAILANKKSFNLSHANIKTETVLVFRKN